VKKVRLLGGAGTAPESWQQFHEGTVFRLQRLGSTKEHLEVRFDPQTYRYLSVEISGAGPPVPIKSLEVDRVPRLALFEFRPDLTYRLFYDNPQARPVTRPDNLAQSLNVSRALAVSGEITLGEEQKPAPPPRPKTMAPHKDARLPLFWKIAGMSVLLLGLLLLFSLMLRARSQRREQRRRGPRLMDTRI
jgi:hypothetical protein